MNYNLKSSENIYQPHIDLNTTHPDDRDEESIISLYGNINVHIVIPA